MEISQKRSTARTRYVFHDDRVEYSWKDSSGSRSFSVPYVDISRDRQTLTERNVWLRNVGYFWTALGLLLLVISLNEEGGIRGGLWLVLGVGCLAAYYAYPTKYKILPSDKGNLLVLDHGDAGARIEAEIEQRRAAQFRQEYDFFPEGDSTAQLRNRFNWLHREGALDDAQLQERLARVAAMEHREAEPFPEPVTRTLN
ncbi:hypothetical protein [Cognatiluteimonas lumbrici]|uniref:hypothetical protein n=1 Tax=Cognatiluteimonas lumbrici TaxID=2559601 RepID=UPI00112AECAE|nr:hypothetical protein [Luteimonas lumbrici]